MTRIGLRARHWIGVGLALAALPLVRGVAARQAGTPPPPSSTACVEACVSSGSSREACGDRCHCRQECLADGASAAKCDAACGLAPGAAPGDRSERAAPRLSDPPAPAGGLLAGTYTCDGCRRSQTWRIENGLLFWDGTPYVPVGGYTGNQNHPPAITEFKVWVDGDFADLGLTEAQYFDRLDTLTSRITAEGKTYMLLVAYPQPPREASWLADESEISRMEAVWRRYAPRVRKDGLRAIALFNEINWEWRWGPERTPAQYGALLRRLAERAQRIFGEVPILYKTSGAGGGFANVVAGAALASGLGFDIYPRSCDANGFDRTSAADLSTLRSAIPSSLGLLWAAEFGKRSDKTEQQLRGMPLWAGYEPFATKAELQCFLDGLIADGMTGFMHGLARPGGENGNTYQWYAELKPYVQKRVLSRRGP
jgi:hypothetical protein